MNWFDVCSRMTPCFSYRSLVARLSYCLCFRISPPRSLSSL
jgi:hypothetical protein